MRLILLAAVLFLLTAGGGDFSVIAQNRVNGDATVADKNKNQTNSKKTKGDISKVDFRNFTFPDFNPADPAKTFTLKDGKGQDKQTFPKYTLRKTYYFELNGDENDEAISHIIVDGCQMACETSHLFYIYTGDKNQPKLLRKIGVGGDVYGGLKSAHFNSREIIFEVFGESEYSDGLMKTNVDLKKNPSVTTNSYTRFVFAFGEKELVQKSREVLPIPENLNLIDYRPLITFGEM